MKANSCIECGTQFTSWRKMKYCSMTCKWRKYKRLTRRVLGQAIYSHTSTTQFSESKHTYVDRLVEYSGSPTGKAYAGFAKHPLMKQENGFGFQGVLLQSENRALVQCAECGTWLSQLNSHLKIHRTTAQQYKEKFGLYATTSLVSDVVSNNLSNSVRKREMHPKMKANVGLFSRRKLQRINGSTKMEHKNRRGTCPEQLKSEMMWYIHRFHCLPGAKLRGGLFTKYRTILDRFGTMNNACIAYGLPQRKNFGRYTRYLFADGSTYDHPHKTSLDILYTVLLKKCPVLHQYPLPQ